MIKFFAIVFSLSLMILRFYLIYKLIWWLTINYSNPNINILEIQWYLGLIILDMYGSSIEKSYQVDIYTKKDDEKSN